MFPILLCILLVWLSVEDCSFTVLDDGQPKKVTNPPHMVDDLTVCIQYMNKQGCCNQNNDRAQVKSYGEIDGVFGALGGGCDVCGINLKRIWCEYACSPRQAEFTQVSDKFEPMPDPQNPDKELMVQRVKLTVHADTACDLFNSCQRVPFVSSVSAMSTPAGFLTFQGHNAVDDAFQYIEVDFSYNKSNSMYFDDTHNDTEPERASLTPCNYKSTEDTLHGFQLNKNCTCNTCEASCEGGTGFIYTESGVFEEFDLWVVVGVWAGVITITSILTIFRKKQKQQ